MNTDFSDLIVKELKTPACAHPQNSRRFFVPPPVKTSSLKLCGQIESVSTPMQIKSNSSTSPMDDVSFSPMLSKKKTFYAD